MGKRNTIDNTGAASAVANTGATGMPLQQIPYSQKTPAWYQQNVNHLITISPLALGANSVGNTEQDIDLLYNAYNSQFPMSWFKHITDPLNAKDKKNKSFPAKIRPVSILRKNIDLLLGEYPRRPMIYNIENMGDEGYNQYCDQMEKLAQGNLTQHFIQAALEQAQASGQQLTPQQMQQLQQDPPMPEQVKEEFMSSYKDAIAIKAQKWLNRTIRDREMKRYFLKMFKDYLIAGQVYSYKAIENEELVYRRYSPKYIDYDKSTETDFIEDGSWVRAVDYLTIPEIVDRYYMDLKAEDLESLETKSMLVTPDAFFSYLQGLTLANKYGKAPVYHVQWKGRKMQRFLSYLDPETMQPVEEMVDEDYKPDKTKGETVEDVWTNEVYEGTRITNNIFVRCRPLSVQRNEATNHSRCKLSYNGRKYSDTHSKNISVLELGLPFQIMVIITTYILEKTIAKSKGKIVLIDQNAIPDQEGWDEEKFFYYCEALGYGLLNRDQAGVDKSWNQYQVLDLSLFEQIKQLIGLIDSFKQQWDDVIGITRQRQGETMASDGQGVNERAVFQSTVITDMIFIGFEEFIQRELQGVLDFAKFLTAKGEKSMLGNSDYGAALFEILPEDFTMANLGIFLEASSEIIRKKQKIEDMALAMVQNNAKPSTVLEVINAVNIAELRQKLLYIESMEQEQIKYQQQSQQDAEMQQEAMKEKFEHFLKLLERDNMEAEYDRKEDLEYIRGTFATFDARGPVAGGDANANNVPDATEVMKIIDARKTRDMEFADRKANRDLSRQKLVNDTQQMQHDMKMDKENLKVNKAKVRVAAKKKATK